MPALLSCCLPLSLPATHSHTLDRFRATTLAAKMNGKMFVLFLQPAQWLDMGFTANVKRNNCFFGSCLRPLLPITEIFASDNDERFFALAYRGQF